MDQPEVQPSADQGISKVKLAIGAASLFLFIIGVKRTFQMEQTDSSAEEGGSAKAAKTGNKSEGKKRKKR